MNYKGAKTVETIKVVFGDSFMRINKKDFDPKTMVVYESEDVPSDETPAPPLLNINLATDKELIDLPGVGLSGAKKIVEGRPYSTIEALPVSKTVFDKIASLITV